jgi:hypothetical protein
MRRPSLFTVCGGQFRRDNEYCETKSLPRSLPAAPCNMTKKWNNAVGLSVKEGLPNPFFHANELPTTSITGIDKRDVFAYALTAAMG